MSYSIKRGRLAKRRTFSVFHDMENVVGTNIQTGEIVDDPGRMQIEAVYYEGKGPGRATPIAMYIVIDGERIAYRGREDGMPAWIPMKEGLVFHNGIDTPGSDALH